MDEQALPIDLEEPPWPQDPPFREEKRNALLAELEARERGEAGQSGDERHERHIAIVKAWRDARERHKRWLYAEVARRTDEDWDRVLYDEPLRQAAAELARAQRPIREALEVVEQKQRERAAGRAKGARAARAAKLEKLSADDENLRARAERLQRMESLSNSQIAERLGCSRRKVAKLFGEPWSS